MSNPLDDYAERCPLPPGYDSTNARVFSSSQFDVGDDCPRKWVFKHGPFKLPDPPYKNQDGTIPALFGTVLHGAAERWLLADDLGRLNGKPVDLFPKGWDAEITPAEAGQIKRHILKATHTGMLTRLPGREIEHDFLRELTVAEDGTTLFVRGTVDMQTLETDPPVIVDHKTRKNRAKIVSPAKLKKANQPLVYGYNMLVEFEEHGRLAPETITITHNNFVKEDEKEAEYQREVIAEITPAEIVQRWELLKERAKYLHGLTKIKNWQDLPVTSNRAHSCRICPYVGICGGRESPEFFKRRLEIAAKNPSNQEKRVMPPTVLAQNIAAPKKAGVPPAAASAPVNGTTPAAKAPPPKAAPKAPVKLPPAKAPDPQYWLQAPSDAEPSLVPKVAVQIAVNAHGAAEVFCAPEGAEGLSPASEHGFEQFKASDVSNALAELSTPAPAEDAPATEGAASVPLERAEAGKTGEQLPPWSVADCTACASSATPGFSTNGKPCRICDTTSKAKGGPISSGYAIVEIEKGVYGWEKGAAATPPAKPASKPTAPAAKAPVKAAPKAPEPAPEAPIEEQGSAETGTSDDGQEQDAPAETPANGTTPAVLGKRGRGRPRVGFTLMQGIGCTKGSNSFLNGCVQLDELYIRWCAELAAVSQVEHFVDLEVWDRRAAMVRGMPAVVAQIGTSTVLVSASKATPDYEAFVEALRPYAGVILEGLK